MKHDALIFDMDGTLWDATDSYVKAFNHAFETLNLPYKVDRKSLESVTGMGRIQCFEKLFPEIHSKDYDFISVQINKSQDEVMPIFGGKMYENVFSGLEILSKKYKIFILSNCQINGIKHMIKFCKINEFITDEFAHGKNNMPKHFNIKLLIEDYDLKNPAYIGDTDGDRKDCEIAQIPFYFMTYGFGKTNIYIEKFDNFNQLTQYFMK